MEIAQIVAIGLVAAVLTVTIKEQRAELGMIIGIAASVLIFFMILPRLSVIIDVLKNLGVRSGVSSTYVGLILKIIGIAYIAELGSQLCADAGEGAIASKIELAGKVLIMLVSAPVLLALLDVITQIL